MRFPSVLVLHVMLRVPEIFTISSWRFFDIAGGECTPDGKFSLDACRCVGACGLAPVMMVNGEVYGRLTVDDIDGVLRNITSHDA